MRVAIHLTLGVLLLLSACRLARIEPFGETKLEFLCQDTKRCEARGDKVVNLLKNKSALRLYIAPEKGPEQLLGKVAPERKADSVMKSCGKEITVSDWLQAPDSIRQFTLGQQGKHELQQRLRAYLAARVSSLSIPEKQTVEGSLAAVVDAIALERVSWVSQTYWLTDTAFERRVGQCGEEERDNIIYSLTVLSPSQAFQADLAEKLEAALNAKLVLKADGGAPTPDATDDAGAAVLDTPPSAQEEEGAGQRNDTIARDVVSALARDTRVVAALGFDDL